MRESERLVRTVEAIARHDYAARHAPAGWQYAARFESRFIDGDLVAQPVRRRAEVAPAVREVADVGAAAAEHLARLADITSVPRLHAAIEELVTLDASTVRDDGGDPATLFADDERLGVVIVGAGPVGLSLASALRVALGARVNVLVVDNRVASPHHKRAYERRWLTAVGQDCFATIVEEPLRALFAKVGTKQVGLSIDCLETLLLLSCRRMGVRFHFVDAPDLAFVATRPVHLVFDATGNRLQPVADTGPVSVAAIGSPLPVNAPLLASYGVDMTCAEGPPVEMASTGSLRYPLYRGKRLVQAALKVTQLPARLCGALVEHVAPTNQDNKHYIWRGSLRDEINQGLVLVNLLRAEYEALCATHEFPLALADVRAALDPRTVDLFAWIAAHASDAEIARIRIEAPFVWRPYWIDERVPARLHGAPVVRVGDSIYAGNVKLANALGPHLRHVAHIQRVLWTHAAGARAERIARAMG